jgi:hypothetical protein
MLLRAHARDFSNPRDRVSSQRLDPVRPPQQKAPFHHGHGSIDREHEGCQDEHAGKHARHVKYAFGLLDQITEAGGGAEVFADYGANYGEADLGV